MWTSSGSQGRGEPILFSEQPGIPRLRREQDKLPGRNDSSVMSGCTPFNVAYLIGKTEILAVSCRLARRRRHKSISLRSVIASITVVPGQLGHHLFRAPRLRYGALPTGWPS
jgi:hypothetical protein